LAVRVMILLGATTALGCQNEGPNVDLPISAYRDRMLVQHAQETAPAPDAKPRTVPRDPIAQPAPGQTDLPPRASLMTGPATTSQPAPEDVLTQIPDPTEAAATFQKRRDALAEDQAAQQDQRVVRNFDKVVNQALEFLAKLSRPTQVRLTLSECVQRAIENNYTIRIEAHNPAISQTQVVEAEAAFDVQFFLDSSWANLDRAIEPGTVPGTSDTRSVQGGFRQLLPSGAQTSIALGEQRSKNDIPQGSIKNWNPTYATNMIAQIRQPLLKGFGLDVNRAQINLRRVEYQISYEQFVQKVRDTLLDVETAYWTLAQARRTVTILAESVSQNYITWQNMKERLGHDATQVEVANAESRYQSRYVSLLEAVKGVRDAEDRLKNLLNDPALKLSDELEIIPTEIPTVAPTVLDQFAEVRTALERRSEIRQAQQRIEGTRINTAVTKNAILPQLDVSFQYEVQGLGKTGDNSYDNLASNRFISYTLGASFSYSFGERAARAAHRRARLQESQAVVQLNQVTDAVVEEVNLNVRQLMVRYEQLPPALTSVEAAVRNLRSLQARTQRIDPNYLETELSAVEQLSNSRRTLLQVVTDYNTGVVQLEKAKGTLLDYNNVVVTDAKAGR
jgi:outer membrane protein TolC